MEKCDILIIGAGVVGLAVAQYLSQNSKTSSIIVVEKHESFGRETSSRNSEVIHAGISYPQHTLKATLCVAGRNLLYPFLEKNNLPYRKIGKLIVAEGKEEEEKLEDLLINAKQNGVDDVCFIEKKQIELWEPAIRATLALSSPSTGIFDTHAFMKYLEADAVKDGVIFAYNCYLLAIEKNNSGFRILIKDADGIEVEVQSDIIINCAGLYAADIARLAGIDCEKAGYTQYFSKGEYFKVNGLADCRINRLIYPLPQKDSLGIHTVLDLQGQFKLGPNAFYVNEIDYQVDLSHRGDFFHSVKKYLPFIEEEMLSADMSGIRPKLQAPGENFADFVIAEESSKNLRGLINLIGIESPGLTSSLAIARYVAEIL
jgi:L-2-hydroxyglutarate oxidase LhgO